MARRHFLIFNACDSLGGIQTHTDLLDSVLKSLGHRCQVVNRKMLTSSIPFWDRNSIFIFQDIKSWDFFGYYSSQSNLKVTWIHTLDMYRKFGTLSSKDIFKTDGKRLLLRKYSLIVTVSSLLQEFFLNFSSSINDPHVHLIRNCPIFPEIKETLPPADRPIDVAFVGRIECDKNLGDLCSILNLLADQGNLRISVVGSGDDEILGQLRRRSEITLHGAVTHRRVIEILSESKVLLLPSLFESDPFVVLEACSLGCKALLHPNAKTWLDRGSSLSVYFPSSASVDSWLSALKSMLNSKFQDKRDYDHSLELARFTKEVDCLVKSLDNTARTSSLQGLPRP